MTAMARELSAYSTTCSGSTLRLVTVDSVHECTADSTDSVLDLTELAASCHDALSMSPPPDAEAEAEADAEADDVDDGLRADAPAPLS